MVSLFHFPDLQTAEFTQDVQRQLNLTDQELADVEKIAWATKPIKQITDLDRRMRAALGLVYINDELYGPTDAPDLLFLMAATIADVVELSPTPSPHDSLESEPARTLLHHYLQPRYIHDSDRSFSVNVACEAVACNIAEYLFSCCLNGIKADPNIAGSNDERLAIVYTDADGKPLAFQKNQGTSTALTVRDIKHPDGTIAPGTIVQIDIEPDTWQIIRNLHTDSLVVKVPYDQTGNTMDVYPIRPSTFLLPTAYREVVTNHYPMVEFQAPLDSLDTVTKLVDTAALSAHTIE